MNDLTLDMAVNIARGALGWAREHSCKPLSVVVLDAGGHVKLVMREDGTGYFGVSIATAKAKSVLGFNVESSRTLGERFEDKPGIVAALSVITGGNLLPGAGGRQIRNAANVLLGAVASAGAKPDEDEAAVLASLSSVGLSY